MRQLILLVAGALIGALAAFSVANTLRQRHAWPRGVMAVMQHHYAALRDARQQNRCDAAATGGHWRLIAAVAADIGPSNEATEPDFVRQAQAFAVTTAQLAAQPPADCPALDAALPTVKEACDGCHRDYR